MKKFSILKLVCMILCSFSLFAACASNGGSNSGGSSNDSGTNTGTGSSSSSGSGTGTGGDSGTGTGGDSGTGTGGGSGTGTGGGSGTGTGGGSGTGTGGGSDSGDGSGEGSGTGSSGDNPDDDGIIKNYDPYISPTKRHIIANEYLNCKDSYYSTLYFITESGEVYYHETEYSSGYYRLKIFDKLNTKITDDVKIVSGECIKGSRNAILKSNEGRYYITNMKYNTSIELTFYKTSDSPYEASDEVKFGNVELSGSYYLSLKDGVAHLWKTSQESKPIKVSGDIFVEQIVKKNNVMYALSKMGVIYKMNDTSTMFEEIYAENNVFFKQFYLGAFLFAISNDNILYYLNTSSNQMEEFALIYAKKNG